MLTDNELKTITGGKFTFTMGAIIGGIVTFIVSAIDGYLRPYKCH